VRFFNSVFIFQFLRGVLHVRYGMFSCAFGSYLHVFGLRTKKP